MKRLEFCRGLAAALCLVLVAGVSQARELTSKVTEPETLTRLRPEFPVPSEPNQLFYIERSVNSNTVIYTANLDGKGHLDGQNPVTAYWRWYNVDGHKKGLNLPERMMAYGIKTVKRDGLNGFSFKVAALPERTLYVSQDDKGRPEAFARIAGRMVRLVYVYLEVDDHGLLPDVTALDLFGFDKATGKPVREHVIPH
jgi:hypothetical protein